jgi:hypothetical protein
MLPVASPKMSLPPLVAKRTRELLARAVRLIGWFR